MVARSLILIAIAAAACGGPAQPTQPTAPSASQPLPDRVAADFEAAVKASKDAYVDLFDFASVGEYEILLHRYDLLGRFPNLEPAKRTQFEGEDGTPYPPTRERRNVGNFYPILAQRTVGTGGCTAHKPRSHYGRLLGKHFDDLPADAPAGYAKLRADANAWLDRGGVVGITCTGGQGGIAVVYTATGSPRGYALITIYDDVQ